MCIYSEQSFYLLICAHSDIMKFPLGKYCGRTVNISSVYSVSVFFCKFNFVFREKKKTGGDFISKHTQFICIWVQKKTTLENAYLCLLWALIRFTWRNHCHGHCQAEKSTLFVFFIACGLKDSIYFWFILKFTI